MTCSSATSRKCGSSGWASAGASPTMMGRAAWMGCGAVPNCLACSGETCSTGSYSVRPSWKPIIARLSSFYKTSAGMHCAALTEVAKCVGEVTCSTAEHSNFVRRGREQFGLLQQRRFLRGVPRGGELGGAA